MHRPTGFKRTLLTAADPRQHPKTPGQRIPLTLLTPATATTPASQLHHAPRGWTTLRREPHIKLADLLTELDMSRAAFYCMRARGKAPRSIKLPNGQLRFRRSDFEKWLHDHEEVPAC
ncbi:helix-turn-helix transcriptional regulator [Streptomyces sp. NBC_01429]|uniref:helix-turn-helix transcriptional regulator n=1 Tax=Streptomyces sp. NBC_01429 TaxID=2903862 RepID=UPI003FCE0C5A